MHLTLKKLNLIKNKVNDIIVKKQLKTDPKIIAVTKTFTIDKIKPLIDEGHIHFGENKLQEAEKKWPDVIKTFSSVKLHMIGKLQSNKAKKAVQLFDYIHSLDNIKLAKKISQYEKELSKKIKLFIQVNLAEEKQKSGILLKDLNDFYNYCRDKLDLNIIGLMCLPPIHPGSNKYFQILKKKSEELNLHEISMGMSADYEEAVSTGSTFIRIGSAIFGERKIN